jgi:pyruvate,water dikinase
MTTLANYVDLRIPRRVAEAVQFGADGVGLLRAEFLIYKSGRHPMLLLGDAVPNDLASILADGMRRVAKAMYPRPVTYRMLDLRSSELRDLAGGADFEGGEVNPLLGQRGMVRAQRDPEMFAVELAAVRRVRAEDYDNLHVMLPFVRWPQEVEWALSYMESAGLRGTNRPNLSIMVETPAAILRAQEFAPLIDGVCVGTEDLSQLVLGVDQENNAFMQQRWDNDPAVLAAVQWAVEAYAACGVPVGVAGDAPSYSPQLLTDLARWGASSVSVSLDRFAALMEAVDAATVSAVAPSD